MKYKLICCDFDGTLCGNDGKIPQKNIDAIRDYVGRGGKFVFLTGRMPHCMDKWVRLIGTQSQPLSVAGFHGGLAVDSRGEEVVKAAICPEISEKIIASAEEQGLYVHTYDGRFVVLAKNNFISENYCETCGIESREVGRLSEYVGDNKLGCYKIVMVVDPRVQKEVFGKFEAANYPGVKFVTSSEYFIEAVPEAGGKGNALIKIAEYYGIPLSDTIAIGDQNNDIGMIKNAGLGCCVGNALEEVQKISDYVADTNDNAGVAEIIEKFTEV